MIIGDGIPEFVECVDLKSVRVYAPTSVLFVCGGQTDLGADTYLSLRDAFIHISGRSQLSNHDVILAEELNGFFFSDGTYRDILKFEADIAQISELIVLFSESFGSAAELGAFSMVPEIAANLLVVIDDGNYSDQSFIKLGPIRALEGSYGDRTVYVMHRRDINITSIKDVRSLDIEAFAQRIISAVSLRATEARKHSSFDSRRDGHLIKFIVGIIQHYGSLTLDEIEVAIYCLDLNVPRGRILDYLLCAEFVKWICKDKRGMTTFYSARNGKLAISYKLKHNFGAIDKDRWQSDIREYWKKSDVDRFTSINQAARM